MRSKDPELMERIRSFAEQYYVDRGAYPSTTEIAQAVGIARGTAYKYLVAMDGSGMIRYDGGSITTEVTGKVENAGRGTPICGSIPCGEPMDEKENIEKIVVLPTAIFGNEELFILTADGDSMIGAGIDDGDLVVLARKTQPREGDIVAALVDDTLSTLKRYHVDKSTGKTMLLAENPKYAPIIPRRSLAVQGIARSVIKQL